MGKQGIQVGNEEIKLSIHILHGYLHKMIQIYLHKLVTTVHFKKYHKYKKFVDL